MFAGDELERGERLAERLAERVVLLTLRDGAARGAARGAAGLLARRGRAEQRRRAASAGALGSLAGRRQGQRSRRAARHPRRATLAALPYRHEIEDKVEPLKAFGVILFFIGLGFDISALKVEQIFGGLVDGIILAVMLVVLTIP